MAGVQSNLFSSKTVIAGRYEIVSCIGTGGMGRVVLAIDRNLDNEQVILKIFYSHLLVNPDVFTRFQDEIKKVRELSHPNVLHVHDFDHSEAHGHFISMEYIEGVNLTQVIHDARESGLPIDEVLKIVFDISNGLQHAHDRGVVHKDLKPDNILVSEKGEIKVTDFGLAQTLQVQKGLTQTGEALGTPHYMSPEQFRGEIPDVRSDIYSLGIIAYELATGSKAYTGEGFFKLADKHLNAPLPNFTEIGSDLPEWFKDFVRKCLAKKQTDRFQSMSEVIAELSSHLTDGAKGKVSKVIKYSFVTKTKAKRLKKLERLILYSVSGFILTVLIITAVQRFARLYVGTQLLSLERIIGVKLTPLTNFYRIYSSTLDNSNWFDLVRKDDEDSINVLTRLGVDLTITEEGGNTLLHAAAQVQRGVVANFLVEAGLDLTAVNSAGDTPLHVAIKHNNISAFHEFVMGKSNFPPFQRRLDLVKKDRDGNTPLHLSVLRRNDYFIGVLLTQGVDTNIRNTQGLAPLHLAAQDGFAAGVTYLVSSYSADADVRDLEGKTALMYAASKGGQRTEMNSTFLHLVHLKSNLNARDNQSRTVLMHATIQDNFFAVKLLINNPVDINAVDNFGWTALDYAYAGSSKQLVNTLEQAGAKSKIFERDKIAQFFFQSYKLW